MLLNLKTKISILYLLPLLLAAQNLGREFPITEKEESGKMEWRLHRAVEDMQTRGAEEKTRIILELKKIPTKEQLAQLKKYGCEIELTVERYIQASALPNAIKKVAKLDFVKEIFLPMKPISEQQNSFGSPTETFNLNEIHKAGINGKGVKVAVLDNGFNVNPANPILKGKPVKIFSFRRDGDILGGSLAGSQHGTDCAEVIRDIAPEADLYLYNFETELEYLEAIRSCLELNIDVISTSVFWPNVFDYFNGKSIFSMVANEAVNKGTVFCIAAGNRAQMHYVGKFQDTDNDQCHNFYEDDETCNLNFKFGDFYSILLTWDDWEKKEQDLDIYLGIIDQKNQFRPINVSKSKQGKGGIKPVENLYGEIPKSGTYHIVVTKGDEIKKNVEFHIYIFVYGSSAEELKMEYVCPEKSLDCGIATAKMPITVGAIEPQTDIIAPYSSQGPTSDGRIKPDLVAPGTVRLSGGIFTGTSAAAPMVAGIATLMLSANPNLKGKGVKVKQILMDTADDLGKPGFDPVYGAGKINPLTAINSAKKVSN